MVKNEKSRSVAAKGYLGFCLFSHCYAAESALLGLILIIIIIIINMVLFTSYVGPPSSLTTSQILLFPLRTSHLSQHITKTATTLSAHFLLFLRTFTGSNGEA